MLSMQCVYFCRIGWILALLSYQVQFPDKALWSDFSAGRLVALWTPGSSLWKAVVGFVIPAHSWQCTPCLLFLVSMVGLPLLHRHLGDTRRLWLWPRLCLLLRPQLHLRSDQGEKHWEQNEAVEEPKDNCEDEDLEEGEEGVGGGAGEEDEGEEGGDASVQNRRTDCFHCAHCSLALWPLWKERSGESWNKPVLISSPA